MAAVVTLTPSGYLQAHSAEIWNTEDIATISHHSFPHMKGGYLVWQAHGGLAGAVSGPGDWEVFLYDVECQAVIQITDDDFDDISPQTDGDYVAWQKHNSSMGNQIFLYGLKAEGPLGGRMISNDTGDHYSPQIAAGRVVWTSQRVAHSFEPGEIMLYDAKNLSGPHSISDTTFDCSFPRINDEMVVWMQSDANGMTTLFMYNLTSENPEPEPAPDGFVWTDSPQTDGNLAVLARYDGTDREIVAYSNASRRYEQITDNDLEDRYPRISGNYISWVGAEGQDSEIHLAFYDPKHITLLSPADGAVLPKRPCTTYYWNSEGYQKFKVQFSQDPDFPTKQTLTFPRARMRWLSETSFTPRRSQWKRVKRMVRRNGYVYWRVTGRDENRSQGLSETWGFTIE